MLDASLYDISECTNIFSESFDGIDTITLIKIKPKDNINVTKGTIYLHNDDISVGTTILSRVLIKGQWLDFESKVTGDGELSIEFDEQIFNNPLEILVIR